MTNRRRPASTVTPLIEDGGLFKREVRDVAVELIPVFSLNNRRDLVVEGVVRPGTEIEVVFAGRRAPHAASLVERMKVMRSIGVQQSANGHDAMTRLKQLRLSIQVRGTWRLRFEPDDSGWEIKKYQLLAAQWAFQDIEGYKVLAGWPPVEPKNRLQDRARAERARLAAVRTRMMEPQSR